MSKFDHLSIHYRKKALPLKLVQKTLKKQQQRIYIQFTKLFPPAEYTKILDLGVNGSLDQPELYFFEYNYPFKEKITAAGLEASTSFSNFYPKIRYVTVRRNEPLPFPDKSFDIVFCNAVLEHVGSRELQKHFLQEIFRVGRNAFVTTPNRWYPVELHTVLPLLHWLPTPVYRYLYKLLGFDFFSREENLNLLSRGSLKKLAVTTQALSIHTHRFLGMVSNLILVARQ